MGACAYARARAPASPRSGTFRLVANAPGRGRPLRGTRALTPWGGGIRGEKGSRRAGSGRVPSRKPEVHVGSNAKDSRLPAFRDAP
jgi:hypothetical protein